MNNVIEFPINRSMRMEQAIKALDSGDISLELANEFKLLANDGLYEADFFLGCMYEDGTNGLSKDIPLALQHYENAANEIGCLEAYLAQARLLYNGYGGVEKDLDTAKRVYELVKDYDQQDGKPQLPEKNEEVAEKSGLKVLLASAVYTL